MKQTVNVVRPSALPAAKVALERDAGKRVARLAVAGARRVARRRRAAGSSLRALDVRPGRQFRWRSVAPLRAPKPLAAVVRPLAVATCDSFTASVPLYTGLIARALGARDVTLMDARPSVRAHSEALGIPAVTVRDARKLDPAPLVVDSTTTPKGLRLAVGLTAADGVCSSIGSLHKTVTLPFSAMYGRNITLHVGRAHARAVIPQVLELMTSGRLAPERVTTLVAPMDDAISVLGEHVRGGSTKTILTAL
jgi:alcohol dehydrogenase